MKEYSYKEIKNITQAGILFRDGYKLLFEECSHEWSKENRIREDKSNCVAVRDALACTPYFLFSAENKVKILCDKKGFMSRKRNMHDFHYLQVTLNRSGFSSYDLT